MIELNNINSEFEEIKNIDSNVKNIFNSLNGKINIFKTIYKSYLKDKNENILLFGLDTLHYQTFLLEFECNSLINMYKLITNKLYCQYYKLLKLIINYIDNLKEFKEVHNDFVNYILNKKGNYPLYNDLELFKDYDFTVIEKLQFDIYDIIKNLILFSNNKEIILKKDEEKSNNGLNIGIFVNAIQFDISIVKQNIELYKGYLKIFNNYHRQYYSRLYIRLLILNGQINSDIKFENINKLDDSHDVYSNAFQNEIIEKINCLNIPDEINNEFETIQNNITINENNHKETHLENIVLQDVSNNCILMNISNISNISNVDIGEDIGGLTTDELKDKWNSIIDNIQIRNDGDILIERDYTSTSTIESIKEDTTETEILENSINLIENDKDEIDKWREIITNTELTQDEKNKLKVKLKRKKRKNK
jgi:hypothetical protein